MAQEIPVITSPEQVSESVTALRDPEQSQALLCELGGGVLRFAAVIYRDVPNERIYASKSEREPEGKGPHFDLYGSLIDEAQPLLGVYNLSGTSQVRSAKLSDDLAKIYFNTYPGLDDSAYEARRHFSAITLNAANTTVYEGSLKPGMGLVLPQFEKGPHIIHEITPESRIVPGEFIKVIVPAKTKKGQKAAAESGYIALDEFVTNSLRADIGQMLDRQPDSVTQLPNTPGPQRQPRQKRSRRSRRSSGGGGGPAVYD